ncbi:hypothetical protein [Desulfovibrio sp.]|uniref:hypothetical protein n=1 Tax=Desulfovibrio sp. TaxID=885 RepID=UPI0025BE7C92|nr:hypothetical protein [Desulfovibrio sp.]
MVHRRGTTVSVALIAMTMLAMTLTPDGNPLRLIGLAAAVWTIWVAIGVEQTRVPLVNRASLATAGDNRHDAFI